MTPSLHRHRQRTLALQLLQRRLRSTPVQHLTGLPINEVRALHRAVHGVSAASGPLHHAASLMVNRRVQAQLSVYALLYRRLADANALQTIDTDALIRSYDLFVELGGQRPETSAGREFHFTAAYVLVRDLCAGAVHLLPCGSCGISYLVAAEAPVPPTCPFCPRRAPRPRARGLDTSHYRPQERGENS
ncbi:FlhC family transcriptional regulator [Methylotetracoccus oryzae]|uniref:FlhC family transcriptional regulator n=1 Tax=Methylotetracoccus oryzae TaxID=1919059 RepID=UPI0013A55742|nr:FlhC family transcriptional regulator [Methylotetracoccus oryzae]